jgi:hypothetical protein
MAYMNQYSWQQQPGETDKAYQAFVTYRNLEPEQRSITRVVSELNKSRTLIGRWSSQWSWVERAREWDAHQDLRRIDALLEARKRMDEEHLKIIRAARNKAIAALGMLSVDLLANNPSELRHWITELIRYERLIIGEPESIEERSEKMEVRTTIEERLKAYAPVFQELIDEGAILLDGHHDQPKRENGEDEDFTYDEPDDE